MSNGKREHARETVVAAAGQWILAGEGTIGSQFPGQARDILSAVYSPENARLMLTTDWYQGLTEWDTVRKALLVLAEEEPTAIDAGPTEGAQIVPATGHAAVCFACSYIGPIQPSVDAALPYQQGHNQERHR